MGIGDGPLSVLLCRRPQGNQYTVVIPVLHTVSRPPQAIQL